MRNKARLPCQALLTTLVLCCSAASAATIVLHPSHDNSIYSESNNSNGQGEIFAGVNGNGDLRRGLLQFDVAGSGIPAGSTVSSASLNLTLTRSGGTANSIFELRPLSAAWGEGTSNGLGQGDTPTAGDATWHHRLYNTQLWTSPGGDYGASSGTALLGISNGVYTFPSQSGLVANVQGWLNTPATNFGWILRAANESLPPKSARSFGSRESGNEAPSLVVNYAPAFGSPTTWFSTTGGSWSTGTKWSPSTPPNGPGKNAVLSRSTTSGISVVLDQAVTAGAIQFSNFGGRPNAGFSITGTNTLTLNNSGSIAYITVASGKHSIAAPVALAGNLDVSASSGSTLEISGNIRDNSSARSLTLSNSGTLILSGSNSYTGGTMVYAGTLSINAAHAIPDGSSLIVGNAGSLAFAPVVPSAPAADPVAAVPEPGTMALGATGCFTAASFWAARRAREVRRRIRPGLKAPAPR